jgi:cytochrome c biogenesis protein CcmG, thiol:disulfide interchange protein DsbE
MSHATRPRTVSQPRSRTPLILGVVLAVVAVAAIVAVALTRGDDDDGDATATQVAPALRGEDYAGNPVEIVPGEDGPLMIVFLAHWCPHCNAEIPVLQEWEASGAIPDDLSVVGVSTSVREDAPNYPPDQWITDVGWTWPVLADDAESTFAETYDVSGFPFIVFVDEAGEVTATTTGEQPIEALQALADDAVA